MIRLHPAQKSDKKAIKLLMAPHIERGHILPTRIDTEVFIVASEAEDILGAVALRPLSARIAELGSLVSDQPGVGLGVRLVEAALERARRSGFELVVALTAIPQFFERLDFKASAHAPWIEARQALNWPHPHPIGEESEALAAAQAKSSECLTCPKLTSCRQVQMLHLIPKLNRCAL